MTKKDFILIAETIRALTEKTTKVKVAAAFASALKVTNPRFDDNRFIEACYPEPKKK